jgi:hypothetical protein
MTFERDMADGSRSTGARIWAAFCLQYNLIMLFGCACFSLALASLAPLLLALLIEAIWLLFAIALPGRCDWVLEQTAAAIDRQSHDGLPAALRQRIRATRASANAIIRAANKAADLEPLEQRALIERVNTVQHAFVRLAGLAHSVSDTVSRVSVSDVESEMTRLRYAAQGEKDLVVKVGLKQAIGLLQRRLHERDRVVSALRASETQMRTIETSLSYIRSQLAQGSSPRACAGELEPLALQLATWETLEGETATWLGQTAPSARAVAESSI